MYDVLHSKAAYYMYDELHSKETETNVEETYKETYEHI